MVPSGDFRSFGIELCSCKQVDMFIQLVERAFDATDESHDASRAALSQLMDRCTSAWIEERDPDVPPWLEALIRDLIVSYIDVRQGEEYDAAGMKHPMYSFGDLLALREWIAEEELWRQDSEGNQS